jgi:tetratricopeptide (TPR) repeat protein
LEAIEIYQSLNINNEMYMANCYHSIGCAYNRLGYHEKSLYYFLEALLMFRRLHASAEFEICLNNMHEANESMKTRIKHNINTNQEINVDANNNINANVNTANIRRNRDNPNKCVIS